MDRRAEPRFQVHSSVQITELGDLERQFDCFLVDISAKGMRLVSDESFSSGGKICVELADHLVLAEVKYSRARGNKFITGTEKIHTLSKLALEQDTTRIEKIQALIEDFHLSRSNEVAGIESPPKSDVTPGTMAQNEIQREPLEEIPPSESAGPTLETVDPPLANVSLFSPTTAKPSPPTLVPAPADFERSHRNPVEQRGLDVILSPEPPLETLHTAVPEAPEPDQFGEEIRRYSLQGLNRAKVRRNARSWVLPTAIAAVLAIVAVAGLLLGPFRKNLSSPLAAAAGDESRPTKAPEQILPVDSTGSTAHASDTETVPPPARIPADAPPSPPLPSPIPVNGLTSAPQLHHVSISAIENAWVSACSDGKKGFGRLLLPREKYDFDFYGKAVVRVGNAAGVEITWDGESLGSLGPQGIVRLIELSPAEFRFLPLKPGDGSSDCSERVE
jgi:hypothetical protein